MSFKPIHIAIIYDNTRGLTGRVVPRMKEMLEQRAFTVDIHEVGSGPFDPEKYAGLIIGTPVTGLAIRGAGPSDKIRHFIEELPTLDEKPVAIFSVYELRQGMTFDKMKNVLFEKDITFVAEHAFWFLNPNKGDHIIPAECMVRIR